MSDCYDGCGCGDDPFGNGPKVPRWLNRLSKPWNRTARRTPWSRLHAPVIAYTRHGHGRWYVCLMVPYTFRKVRLWRLAP